MKRGTNGEVVASAEAIAYLHGRIDKEIELFAASSLHCTATELAERLGSLLLGAGIRVEHNVSALREETTGGSSTVAEMALASGSHSKSSGMSEDTRKRLSDLAKKRWADMTPNKRTRLLNKMARARLKGTK
jgi:hypothetical protein